MGMLGGGNLPLYTDSQEKRNAHSHAQDSPTKKGHILSTQTPKGIPMNPFRTNDTPSSERQPTKRPHSPLH